MGREVWDKLVGFCGAHHDAAVRDSVQPPAVQPPVESDDADPCPEPEDEDYFQGPDGVADAVSRREQGRGYQNLNRLPVPTGRILEACLILTSGKEDSSLTWMCHGGMGVSAVQRRNAGQLLSVRYAQKFFVPPYPYSIEENRHNVPLEDCWYAHAPSYSSNAL
jgi:hypothetical protein